ncbi:MAG: helicase-associated domain-containing protein [Thermoplasmata archaeon]|nr:MAG: helicase-associated domain-containing protein [Thermoplasmata archaeon]
MGKKDQSKRTFDITRMESEKSALLAILAMNKGSLSEIKLKRIYLEKFTLWQLQKAEEGLISDGILEKEGNEEKAYFEYRIEKEHMNSLVKSQASKRLAPDKKEHMEPAHPVCCSEYSILWYLWNIDIEMGGLLLSPKPKRDTLAREKMMEELLGLNREGVRFSRQMVDILKEAGSWSERGYRMWNEVLKDTHLLVRDIFILAHDLLRGESRLGRGEVGKDNMDYLLDELARLKVGKWYPLDAFISHARAVLFSANQPFRWVHFDDDGVWQILAMELSILGAVETAENNKNERFVRLTSLGGFCLNKISERRFLKEMSKRQGKFIVHPNFEVTLVAKELDPKVTLELAMFAEPVKLDTASVLRITRGSVEKGKQLGLAPEEMVGFLKEHSRGRIPQNVDYSVRDWGG